MVKPAKSVASMPVLEDIRGLVPGSKATSEVIVELDVDNILPNPYQPSGRLTCVQEEKEALGTDIYQNGQRSPIEVRKCPVDAMKYEASDGWQRTESIRWIRTRYNDRAGMKVKAVIREISDQEMADTITSSAMHRPLTDLDRAEFYQRYMKEFNISQTELAKRLNVTQGHIANTIRLLELPEPVKAKIISQEITPAHGRQLLRLNNLPKQQEKMIEAIQEQHLPVSKVDSEINRIVWNKTKPLGKTPYIDNNDTPEFNIIEVCKDCPHQLTMSSPWGGSDNKYSRCDDPNCWNGKQKAAKNAGRKEDIERLAAVGITKIFNDGELTWKQFTRLGTDIEPDCAKCEKRGAMEFGRRLDIICLDPGCLNKKVDVIRKAEEKERQDKQDKIDRLIDNTFSAMITDEKETMMASIECLLHHVHDNWRGDGQLQPTLERLAGAFDLKQKGDKQNATIKSIMAGLRSKPPGFAETYFLPRLAFESFKKEVHDETQLNAMFQRFYNARQTTDAGNNPAEDEERENEAFQLKKVGTGWVATDKDGVIIALGPTKSVAQADAEDYFEPVVTEIDPTPDKYILNHTFRISFHDHSFADITAQDIATALQALGKKPTDVKEIKVHKSSGKIGTAGDVGSGWSKYTGKLKAPEVNDVPIEGVIKDVLSPPTRADQTIARVEEKWNAGERVVRPDPLDGMMIRVPAQPQQMYRIEMGDEVFMDKYLQPCVVKLGEYLGWGENPEHILKMLRELPESDNRNQLIGIMEQVTTN